MANKILILVANPREPILLPIADPTQAKVRSKSNVKASAHTITVIKL